MSKVSSVYCFNSYDERWLINYSKKPGLIHFIPKTFSIITGDRMRFVPKICRINGDDELIV